MFYIEKAALLWHYHPDIYHYISVLDSLNHIPETRKKEQKHR